MTFLIPTDYKSLEMIIILAIRACFNFFFGFKYKLLYSNPIFDTLTNFLLLKSPTNLLPQWNTKGIEAKVFVIHNKNLFYAGILIKIF